MIDREIDPREEFHHHFCWVPNLDVRSVNIGNSRSFAFFHVFPLQGFKAKQIAKHSGITYKLISEIIQRLAMFLQDQSSSIWLHQRRCVWHLPVLTKDGFYVFPSPTWYRKTPVAGKKLRFDHWSEVFSPSMLVHLESRTHSVGKNSWAPFDTINGSLGSWW